MRSELEREVELKVFVFSHLTKRKVNSGGEVEWSGAGTDGGRRSGTNGIGRRWWEEEEEEEEGRDR